MNFDTLQTELVFLRQRTAELERRIEEQHRAMGALRADESRYRGLIESQQDLIVRTGQDGRFSFVNDAYCQILGKRREELLGQPFAGVIHPDDVHVVVAAIEALAHPPYRTLVENRVPTIEGWRWYAWESSVVRDETGQIVETQAIGRDITAYKQAMEDLERALRSKDEFLATMSHELRTPLNVILGMTEALQSGVYGEIESKQHAVLAMVESSGRHLLAMINDILDLSKIEAGKEQLNLAPVSIPAICRASEQFVRQETERKRITFVQSLDPIAATLLADERRLQQILVNLLNNAVKFTPEGGQVGLEVIADVEREVINFVVWDTGIGIAQEDMTQLFQLFVQLDRGLSRQYGGTGLGLALVARLVELHGGSIAVSSVVSTGSRFTVTLPWHPAELAPVAGESTPSPVSPVIPPAIPLSAGNGARVLLVEDNEGMALVVGEYLATSGYRVSVAGNGPEAFERMRAAPPNVILMDIQLPEMDGLEVIRRLRSNAEWSAIPIIALTALVMPGDQERCLAAGANVYVSKPVRLETLRQIIDEHLDAATT